MRPSARRRRSGSHRCPPCRPRRKRAAGAAGHGLARAPRGTPAPVLERVSRALRGALRDERVTARLADLGSTPESQERATPAAHRAMLDAEIARRRPILQAAGEFAD